MPPAPVSGGTGRGFSHEEIAYKLQLSKCPVADEFLKLLNKCETQFTPQTIDILDTHILSCTSSESVLTNFPTTKDIEIYMLDQDILARKLKCSVPRIDSENPLFHLILAYVKFISEPRYRRAYRGFERDKQNEERIHNEISQKFNLPENKQPSSVFSKF